MIKPVALTSLPDRQQHSVLSEALTADVSSTESIWDTVSQDTSTPTGLDIANTSTESPQADFPLEQEEHLYVSFAFAFHFRTDVAVNL